MNKVIASFSIIISMVLLLVCPAAAQTSSLRLEQLWVIEGFDRPESVIPNADNSELYVSNINGGSTEIDGNGYISRVSLDGKVIEKKWITGLNGPKGFALGDGVLYIADINEIVMVDTKNGAIIDRLSVPDAVFLNDVAYVNGTIFFSDTRTSTLYEYTKPDGLSIFAAGEIISGINGVLAKGDNLLITVMKAGKLISVDIKEKTMTTIGGGIINGDGIGIMEEGGYTITSHTGEIYHVKSSSETVQLLDSKPEKISQNDSYYMNGMLYVANVNPGSITAWKVVR